MFGIQTSFLGYHKSKAVMSVAKTTVVETFNEKTLRAWSDLCKVDLVYLVQIFLTPRQAHGITITPLTPYIDEEIVYYNHLSVDGSKITNTGFQYKHPVVEENEVRRILQLFVEKGFFPDGIV